MKYYFYDLNFEEGNAAVEQYVDYFNYIKHALPPDFLLFADRENTKLSLNDGSVHTVYIDNEKGEAEIVIQSDATDANWRTIGDRRYFLRYSGVKRFHCIDNSDRLGGFSGDHLFDELELLDAGLFEHRMLFRGPVEMLIVFTGFSLEFEDFNIRQS